MSAAAAARSPARADRLNAATKYVVTHRPESLEWGPVESVGRRFFADSTPARSLELLASRAFPSGITLNHYKVVGPLKT